MATNSGRGNSIGAEDGPRPETTPPPVSEELKQDIKGTEATESTGNRTAGHDTGSSLPSTSVATGDQVDNLIRKVADVGGK